MSSKFTSGFLAGLFTGAAFGTILGLLYAPEKGRVTRDRLSFRLNRYVEDLESLVDRVRTHQENLPSEARDRGDKIVLEAKRQADDLISEAEALMRNIKTKAASKTTGSPS